MNQPIQVGGHLSKWIHAGRAAGAIVFFGGVYFVGPKAPWAWILASGGLFLWLLMEFKAWRARRARTWLTVDSDSIEVETAAGERRIHDSQVTDVALEITKHLSSGLVTGYTRKLTLWADDRPDAVRMECRVKSGSADPLADLINRLLTVVRERRQEELAKGGAVGGDGWRLTRSMLTIGQPPRDQQFALGEIAAIESSGSDICVWDRGSELPVARLPLAGKNAHLLPALAQPYLTEQKKDQATAAATSGLGRVLFEKRTSASAIGFLIVVGALLGLAGVLLLAGMGMAGVKGRDKDVPVAFGILMLGSGPVTIAIGACLRYSSFRCCELGVRKSNVFGQQTLKYEDVESFQYGATRHFHNGVYTGTHLTLSFRPTHAGGVIKYSTTTRGEDDDLDSLRDFISRAIAGRMAEKLRAGQEVRWTDNLQFLPDGIRYRPDGFFGRKEAQLLSYADYGGFNFNAGSFYLYAREQKKHVATEKTSADNFHPGFFLLTLMLHQTAAASDDQGRETA